MVPKTSEDEDPCESVSNSSSLVIQRPDWIREDLEEGECP